MSVHYDTVHDVWIYDFWEDGERYNRRCILPDGTRAASRRQAQACEDARRVEVRATAKAARATPGVYTLAQAIAARSADAAGARSFEDMKVELAEILAFFGPATALADAARRWNEYRAFARAQTVKIWIGGPRGRDGAAADPTLWRDTGRRRSPGRVNRYLNQLSAVCSLANRTLGPDDRPLLAIMPRIELVDGPRRQPNPVPLEVVAAIEADPETPDHLWQAAALSRLLGLRLDEVFLAEPAWIDHGLRALRLPAAIAKSGDDEFLDANREAMQLLDWLALFAAERKTARDRLIVYVPAGKDRDGKPFAARAVRNPRRAWKSALKRHGVAGRWRFHDLRGTFITQVALVAPSPRVMQDLARHKSAATSDRYIRITSAARRAAVEAMARTNGLATQSPDAESRRPNLHRVK